MLSAVKNFFLTFVLSAVIFGLIASLAVGLVVNNINGSLASDTDTPETTASETDSGGNVVTPTEDESGSSLNILLLGSDYRPSVLADYDPEMVEKLCPAEETEEEEIKVRPSDLAAPSTRTTIISDDIYSDKNKEYTVLDDDTLMFRNGFYSLSYRVIETDTIILVRLDRERGQISYTSFPADAVTEVSGKEIKLSEIYGTYGVEALTDTIHAITGVNVDRYAIVTMDNFEQIIDALGGVEYTVPCRMVYDDYAGVVHINLRAGSQKLTGSKALQLLMFNSYTDGTNSRTKTTMSFMRALVSALAKPSNVTKMTDFWDLVDGMYETDIQVEDFTKNIALIIKCAQNQIEINAVTKTKITDGETVVYIDDTATADAFASYKRLYSTD